MSNRRMRLEVRLLLEKGCNVAAQVGDLCVRAAIASRMTAPTDAPGKQNVSLAQLMRRGVG